MPQSRVRAAPRRPALLLWGVLTALVVVCAYAIALGMALGCAFLAFAVLGSISLGSLIVAVGAATCAAAILWSLAPRRDLFSPPGPELTASAQPRLFAEISAIAAEFEEPMPAAVYLMLDTNAWVAQRGGLLGFGSRRVMALGLPLLPALTVSEFRAVLAHEFAHYYGGDTGLGPWIQKARDALARSLKSLSSNSGFFSFMSRWAYVALLRLVIVTIFGLYWKVFLRLTLMVSRQWEYRADELACAVAGAAPLVSGLEKVAGVTLAWPSFWNLALVPSLQAGFRPPVADGFARFLSAPAVATRLEASAAARREAEKPHIFATHPTLDQRTGRALSHGYEPVSGENLPAITLLDSAASMELSALQTLFPNVKVAGLPLIDWAQVGRLVYIPSWSAFAGEYGDLLAPYRVGDIPEVVANLGSFATRVRDPKGMLLTREQRAERCAALIWMAFVLALLNDGWQLQTEPGQFRVVRGETRLEPPDLVTRLRQGAMQAAEFHALAEGLEIDGLRLALTRRIGEFATTPSPWR